MEDPKVEKRSEVKTSTKPVTKKITPSTQSPRVINQTPKKPLNTKSTENLKSNSNHTTQSPRIANAKAPLNTKSTENLKNNTPPTSSPIKKPISPKKSLNSTTNNTIPIQKPRSPTKTVKTPPMSKTPSDLSPEKKPTPPIKSETNVTKASSTTKVEKSREDILAEREAKRLAKLAAKNKLKSPVETITPISDPNPISNEIENSTASKGEEKSREEIKAEREAKKLAKQLAKNKGKSGRDGDDGTLTNNAEVLEQKVKVEKQYSITELADKLDHIHITDKSEKKSEKPGPTKAERRAVQEAQRQAKAKLLADKQQSQKPTITAEKSTKSASPLKTIKTKNATASSPDSSSSPKTEHYKIKLFNHLSGTVKEHNLFINNTTIHPAVVRLGEQYAKRTIVGSNARCIAFINAMKTVIQDYETPPKKEFGRGLESSIKNCVDHLHKCRPLAVSINNAHKYIKFILTQLPTDQPDSDLKEGLSELLDNYKRDQIDKAAQAISYSVQEKISNGDVILTFGCSSLINHILDEAHRRNVGFRVILVDSRPFLEGQELLRRLVSKGISCTCVLINAVSFILHEVTKVLLGAHALLANGYVMARTGTAQIALLARSFNVPVLVCCETHKFSERVQTDAIVYNELGNPGDLVHRKNGKENPLENWQSFQKLYPLNLIYDITPPELVTAVVTEVAILPCTSVPVILRIKPTEILY